MSDKSFDDSVQERSLFEGIVVYLNVLLSKKWFIIIPTILVTMGTIVFVIISMRLPPEESPLPNIYRASAMVLISGGDDVSNLYSATGIAQPFETDTIDYGMTAIRILRTRSFMDRIIDSDIFQNSYSNTISPDALRSDVREFLSSKIEVGYNQDLRMLGISYLDINPEVARDLGNKVVEELNFWFSEFGLSQRQKYKNLLEKKLTEIMPKIAEYEVQIKNFQKKYGVFSINDLATFQTETLTNLRSQLILNELEIKNYTEFTKIEDPNLRRLKIERENLVASIKEIESGSSASIGSNLPSMVQLPDLALEFNRLQLNLQIQQGIYQQLSEQYEIVKLTAESESVFNVLEWAEAPDEKDGPQRSIFVIGAFAGTLAVSSLIILASYFLRSFYQKQKRKGII